MLSSWNTGTDSRTRTLARAGGVVACALLFFQLFVLVKLAVHTRLVIERERSQQKKWRIGVLVDTPFTGHLTLERLQYRLSYHTKRFAGHCQHWQFIVWSRQLLQYLITMLPDLIGVPELAHGKVLAGQEARAQVVIWLQVGLSLGSFIIFWGWHTSAHPFPFAFQNAIEHWLFFSSCLFVVVSASCEPARNARADNPSAVPFSVLRAYSRRTVCHERCRHVR